MNRFIKIFLIILLASIVPFFSLCTKEQKNYPLFDTEWEVSSISLPHFSYLLESPTPYQVDFHKDKIFNIKLDVNSCGSTYSLESENIIHIAPLYCTEVCCDKEFANMLINVLKDVRSYKIEGEELELFANDTIIYLSRVKKDN